MAVIKANAYGHGLVPVAQGLPGADALAVARLPEARQLREHGIDKRIVLLAGVLTGNEFDEAVSLGCEVVVHCDEQLDILDRARGGQTVVWVKIDTGMNRLGFEPADARRAVDAARRSSAVADVCLMTHFASADARDLSRTRAQLERFVPLLQEFSGPVSVANSPATLGCGELLSELALAGREIWIRPGLALYGISPFDNRSAKELGLSAVMQFEARLIAQKPLRAGSSVGYRGRYSSPNDTIIGVIAAGYGDGYTRHFRDGTPVLLNGRRVPLIGNVSMDMIAVDLGPDATDAVGDTAILWGDGLPVEEVATWADAIPYELVCGVMNREASEIVA